MILSPHDGNSPDERAVLGFLDMWERQDVEGLVDFFADDGSYIDMPLPPRHGKAAIRDYIERIFTAFSVRIETLHIASAGNVIFTERVDYLAANDGSTTVPLPVTGVMEMKNGKIAIWRDYLDLRTAEEGLGITIRPTDEHGKAIP